MKIRTIFCVAIAALAACSSPTQSINFQPPAGWIATASLFGFQSWHTADRKQVLILFRLPVAIDPNQAMQHTSINNLQDMTTKKITICGKQPAVLVTGRGTSSQTHSEQDFKMLMTSYNGTTYMAIYARDMGTPVNSEADRAVYALCQRS